MDAQKEAKEGAGGVTGAPKRRGRSPGSKNKLKVCVWGGWPVGCPQEAQKCPLQNVNILTTLRPDFGRFHKFAYMCITAGHSIHLT